jgi:Fe-S-cluster containining protein
MGRNDLCFCGSGKKRKKCHPDILETSYAAEVLQSYYLFDQAIQTHFYGKEHPCKPGCSACCYDIFPVSDIEYSLIVYELRKWDQKRLDHLRLKAKNNWEQFCIINPNEAQHMDTFNESVSNWKDVQDLKRIQALPFPCLFLEEGKCSIYSVRPLICRTFGVSYSDDPEDHFEQDMICDKIGSNLIARQWQCDVRALFESRGHMESILSKKYKTQINVRSSPLIYEVYRQFVKYNVGLNIIHEKAKFLSSKQQYSDFLYELKYKRNSLKGLITH